MSERSEARPPGGPRAWSRGGGGGGSSEREQRRQREQLQRRRQPSLLDCSRHSSGRRLPDPASDVRLGEAACEVSVSAAIQLAPPSTSPPPHPTPGLLASSQAGAGRRQLEGVGGARN